MAVQILRPLPMFLSSPHHLLHQHQLQYRINYLCFETQLVAAGKGTVALDEFWMAYFVPVPTNKHICQDITVVAEVTIISKDKEPQKI